MSRITASQAKRQLAALKSHPDPEEAHRDADLILLTYVPDGVRAAYEEVVESCRWWAHS